MSTTHPTGQRIPGLALPGNEAESAKSREPLSPVRSVAETIQGIATVGVVSRPKLESHEGAIGGNLLRAAVLGVNDGLVSNLSLVMGVAGRRWRRELY